MTFVERLLVPPPVPELDLGVGRHVPVVRHGVEAVCRVFYFVGAADGYGLGFTSGIVVGIALTLFFLIVLWLIRAFLKSLAKSFREAVSRRDEVA